MATEVLEKRTVAQLVLRKRHHAPTELGEADTIRAVVLSGFEMMVGEMFDA